MEKLKRFIDCYVPIEMCNLRCHYCYITQKSKFNNKILKLKYSPKEIRKALSTERLEGKCLINLCAGGETLLSSEVIGLIKELLEEGHYVMVVTNGTVSKRLDEICELDSELLKRLFFKFSFHYLELIRLNKINDYFDNIEKVKNKGCSFTVEITPSDELIPHIEDIKKICLERLGALCHITIGRDDRKPGIDILSDYSFEEYNEIWSTFESNLFDYKVSIFYKERKEFCYAGDWSLYINLGTGSLRQCYCGIELDNIFNDISKPLTFNAIGYECSQPHCYNGHAFLALGVIPELDSPTYAELRDRFNSNCQGWLNKEMKAFMSQKLKDNNEEYAELKKEANYIRNSFLRKGKL